MGLHLSIDDFGTGYSSLSYLKRFPIDALKIDRSFIREVTVDPGDAAITTSIVLLGKSLELSVVAEGVETRSQLSFLRVIQCHEGQGYLFSKPVPAAQAETLLVTGLAADLAA
jgi:EAL domain-containing protein (putative c-di-GMP-specific phosphodiesterase class I)